MFNDVMLNIFLKKPIRYVRWNMLVLTIKTACIELLLKTPRTFAQFVQTLPFTLLLFHKD